MRAIKFPGIKRHARTLGISQTQLWRILTGRSKNDAMRERYNDLLRKEATLAKSKSFEMQPGDEFPHANVADALQFATQLRAEGGKDCCKIKGTTVVLKKSLRFFIAAAPESSATPV